MNFNSKKFLSFAIYNLPLTFWLYFLFITKHEVTDCAIVDWSDDQEPGKWNKHAKQTIDSILDRELNTNIAKNIIMFLGDGMGVSTIAAGRIRKGQKLGQNGEELVTNMESFPHLALSKTYNIDAQTPDSAGTGTAYLCGVKTRAGIIGLNGYAKLHDCPSSHDTKLDSILKWAYMSGKSTGIVTNTRITHATPAAAFAHAAFRDWESYDGVKFTKKQHQQGCKDIAAQLIEENSFIDLIIGGGRMKFLPNNLKDYAQNVNGTRIDNRNLIEEWIEKMKDMNRKYKFIWNASDFRNTNLKDYNQVLALLAYDHLKYEVDRDETIEPSLSELTQKAIDMLSRNKRGYFLLVEGGRIDHGHHENKAHKSLDDYVAFDDAIGEALKLVNQDETLIVVTADHSHTFTIGGNSNRGNPVYGIAISYKNLSDVNLTFTSILYGNGPGGLLNIRKTNLTNSITEQSNYTQEAVVFRNSATHAAEDVAVYSTGPMSYLFTQTIEQNIIPHVMAYSACIGPYNNNACRKKRGKYSNGAVHNIISTKIVFIYALFYIRLINF